MPVFDYTFTVKAPLAKVAAFHHNTWVLKRLTPLPIIVQMHRTEPLAEGAVAEFTLWFGPLPIRWLAVHSRVDPMRGFTDTQQQGPLKCWAHTHTFMAEGEQLTRVSEHIEYTHYPGLKGLLSRLLFAKPALYLLFTYRKFITRWSVR
jgi:ligand-binding SRPBCC domain-containing protein